MLDYSAPHLRTAVGLSTKVAGDSAVTPADDLPPASGVGSGTILS